MGSGREKSPANSSHDGLHLPSLETCCRQPLERLQHVQSKCLRIIAGAPWYVSNLQLHEDLEVPYIAEHIRNLAQSFDSKIPGAENLLVRLLGRYLF